jgi:uncharacterized membrane protein YkoI
MKPKFLTGSVLATLLAVGCASEHGEHHRHPNLAAKAKVSRTAAEHTALSRVPGGTVKEAELEKEHGKLIWSFDIATPDSKDITEVAVDAVTGAVVSVEKETPEQQAREKDEAARKDDKM